MQRTTRWAHEPKPEPKPDELPQLYAELFGSPAGQRVLDDIARQAGTPKIDLNDPNPNQALCYAARINLLSYIYNRVAAAKKQ